MTCPTFTNDEVNMPHALRSRSTECKTNNKQKYIHSNLLCSFCSDENDDQQHLLRCKVLATHFTGEDITDGAVEYVDIFSQNVKKQKVISMIYLKLFKIRTKLEENKESQRAPSTMSMALRMSSDLPLCIDLSFSGK